MSRNGTQFQKRREREPSHRILPRIATVLFLPILICRINSYFLHQLQQHFHSAVASACPDFTIGINAIGTITWAQSHQTALPEGPHDLEIFFCRPEQSELSHIYKPFQHWRLRMSLEGLSFLISF